MINTIIAFSLRNKLIIGLGILALIATGIYCMLTINLGAQPDITNNQVQVITQSPNLATEDIEQFVTYPVELFMANLPGVTEIRSISRFGLSVVTIVFKDNMGTYLPRQLVSEKLNEIQSEIPSQFGSPSIGPITTGLGEIYQYTIQPEKGYENTYTTTQLRTIQDWIIKRQLSLTEGVVEVNAIGGNIKQYEIAINPAKLNAMGITMAEVFEALQQNNVNTGGAYIEKNKMANFIRGEGLVRSLEDIRKIVIKNQKGIPILIQDVAEQVHYANQVRYGAFTQDGHEAVGGVILMLKGANANTVIKHVKERMETIQKSLPKGLKIVPFLDQSKLIGRTTATIKKNLVEGALIVIFVLVLLLGSFRGGLVTASLIPLSLLFAFILMKLFGVWANLMSLGAIDFGIIVDGAVIIVEGTVHELEKRIKNKSSFTQEQMDTVVFEASSTVMNTAFFGQIIILIVFTPILFLTGIEGKMFKPMAFTFGFAVLGAIWLCLTYIPVVTALTMKPKKRHSRFTKMEKKISLFSHKTIRFLQHCYRPLLTKSLQHKVWVLCIALGLFIAAGITFSKMGGEFIPSIDEGDIAMQALFKPGTALSEAVATSKKIEKIVLHNFPEVKTMIAKIGVADIPTDPMPMDIADTYIIVDKNKEHWVSAATKKELIAKIKEKLTVIPGVNFVFSQPVALRFNELLTGVREDVAIKLYGDNLNILSEKAVAMAKIIQTVPGAGEVNVEATAGLPQITVHYNRQKIAQYGINIQHLNQYISTAFAGGNAGVVFEGEKRFDMVVRLATAHRKNIDDVKNLLIDLPNGFQIPLQEVASITYQPGPMQISRDNTSRRVYIGVNVQNSDVASMVTAIQRKLAASLQLPPGYHITYGGAFENLQRAKSRLTIVVPIALALIFLLLYFALNSFKQAIMIYMAVPLAAIGGIFALALRGMPFSISAGVGFIVLFGVAVLNGLVLISKFNTLQQEGIVNIQERLLLGTQERLRPILLTALAAIMGFFPMAVSHGAGAAVQRPLATVVIGGLITATLLTLVIIPILYYFISNKATKSVMPNMNKPFMLVLFFMALNTVTNKVQAQNKLNAYPTITVNEAVQKATDNYPAITIAKLQLQQQKVLQKTAWDMGTTTLFTGGEELPDTPNKNQGIYTTIGVQQQNIPIFNIGAKRHLLQEQQKLQSVNIDLQQLLLAQKVKQTWADTYIAKKRYHLYVTLDSLFSRFEKAVALQYETEAISKLSYITVLNQIRQITLEKQQTYSDYMRNIHQLNVYLVSDTIYTVHDSAEKDVIYPIATSSGIDDHPLLAYYEQQLNVAHANRQVQHKKLLPKLNVQYARQQLAGENGYYNFQIGISIPLFFGSALGEVQSAAIQTKITKQALHKQQLQTNAHYAGLLQDYNKWLASWEFYTTQALPLAKEQQAGALLAYTEGSINYTTFLQSVKEAIAIQQQSLNTLHELLTVTYQLQYFLNTKTL
ncbi:CusA/CzcA family heavy metal efflux RND transporter [Zhouia sp. PK063]|uniref:CusA/CzcA family heavy metal efflux RND transporter n=1 Tax=Zhouia sp. PK063 TaxID=3373602 RepID=UPI0037B3E075